MKFGPISVVDSEGALLAHTVRGDGWTLKKGHKLSRRDIETLQSAGIASIHAAVLEPGDVHEDDAAARVAARVRGDGASPTKAFTGRCNIIAEEAGIVRIDAAFINRFNKTDEAVTIATLSDYARVAEGQIVATVKVIPFAVASDVFRGVEDALDDAVQPVCITPFREFSAVLINTTLPALKNSVVAKTTELTCRRVESVGGRVNEVLSCQHDSRSVEDTLRQAMSQKPDLVIVVGASVTVDRADIVPAAIDRAGGEIEHFGMPVDPGNMLVLARLGETPVLVLPGCARSPKLNGIDWVLERIAARMAVTSNDIMAMGVGGLLIDSPARPLPREEAVRERETREDSRMSNIAGLVLAAGQSRRMGAVNKLLETVAGKPLVRRSVEAVLGGGVDPVVVVTGHDNETVEKALTGLNVKIVCNAAFADGLSTSLSAGLAALPASTDAVVVALADMPAVEPHHIRALIDGFDPDAGKLIGVPVFRGKRGNPVLWGRRFWESMSKISGDVGARHLIGEHADLVYEVEFDDTAVLTDLDTPEQLARYRQSNGG